MLIAFNKNFYNRQSVKNAVKAYQKLADFEIEENKATIKVTLKNIDKEVAGVIDDEFSNYVLAEMKNGKRG